MSSAQLLSTFNFQFSTFLCTFALAFQKRAAFEDASHAESGWAVGYLRYVISNNHITHNSHGGTLIIMYLDNSKKTEIFTQYGKSSTDTGSAESQIALFTYRIKHLTEHLKKNHKDFRTARSLTQLVGKRRALLDYLYDRDINRYRAIVKALGLRK